MAKLFNRAKMDTSTTGSGTITLGSAVDGYQSFADAGVADSDVVQYVIEDGTSWEIGTGTYSATGTSLTRTPSESSNAGAAISLTGEAEVFITAVADDMNRLQNAGSDIVTVSASGASVTGNLDVSSGVDVTGNITVTGTVDGRDIATDGSKLDGIESGATADQTITLSGDATGSGTTSIAVSLSADSVGASEIAANAVGASELNVSGNGTTSQFLRSDGDGTFTWATPTDTNTTYSAGTGMSLSGTTFSIGQAVGTGDSPTFNNAYLAGSLYHSGDTDTRLLFGTNTVTLQCGGSSEVTVNTTGVRLGDTGNGYFQPVSGNYGSVQIDGGAHGGYEGYSIGGRAVFMHNNSTTTGIYNDANNQWLFKGTHAAETNMYYNGSVKGYTYSGGFRVTGHLLASQNVYAYYSDERLKAKDGVIEDALGMIGSLDTFYYYENDKAKELGHDNDRRQIGVSAQQVEAIMPEAVAPAPFDLQSDNKGNKWSKSGEDYLTVDYPRLVPLLIKGIQELEARVKELENGTSK